MPPARSGSGRGGRCPPGAGAGQDGEMRFEEAQRELENVVRQLETGQADLDEALKLWERGEELYRFCLDRLDSAQGTIEELAGKIEAMRPQSS